MVYDDINRLLDDVDQSLSQYQRFVDREGQPVGLASTELSSTEELHSDDSQN